MILRPDAASVGLVADVLKNGGTAVLPTDTIYGISGSVPVSCGKIQEIKGRAENKPFIQLIATPEQIFELTDRKIPGVLLSYWPGSLTLIVPDHSGGTTAYRCPGDSWLRNVVACTGTPVYSTSVNFAGEPAYTKIDDIIEKFGNLVDVVVDAGDCRHVLPSTIVSLAGEKPVLVREGAVGGLRETGLFL